MVPYILCDEPSVGESAQGEPSLAGLGEVVRRKTGARSFSRGFSDRVTDISDLASSASICSSKAGDSGLVGAKVSPYDSMIEFVRDVDTLSVDRWLLVRLGVRG